MRRRLPLVVVLMAAALGVFWLAMKDGSSGGDGGGSGEPVSFDCRYATLPPSPGGDSFKMSDGPQNLCEPDGVAEQTEEIGPGDFVTYQRCGEFSRHGNSCLTHCTGRMNETG